MSKHTPGEWRCARCEEVLQPHSVTYNETHDGDCGGPVFFEDETPELDRLRAENAAMRLALEQITVLRPAGDINTATNIRKLVEQMERIAINARTALSATSTGGER